MGALFEPFTPSLASSPFFSGIAPAPAITASHQWIKALHLDVSLDLISRTANQYKILQDRFRQARTVSALGTFDEFNKEFQARMQQMDALRSASLPPPECFFKKAQRKIQSGDYDFTADIKKQNP
jgi:hypothetical protein